ncbi:ParB/RepB/Spo0J family partition protein [Streptomyces rubellomurinus]|uniref:ParB/RepB/Spo0J family partition protein n=1 Tax=Streptomyces rubellomurinus (strain ATCC 31215) TaxID=359131 RepID=UPI0012FE9E88|nr:ParB/RepB/Spo0J family partition protein [Streptomyces rubellomurinus]
MVQTDTCEVTSLGDADFIALDGNRRLRAAQRAGLPTLRVDLNDELAATASDLVEAALVANVHREDVAPFEEAQAIEQLVNEVYGGNQAAVARKLGKSAAWVGQRLALLHLAPELQELASAGDLAIEDARKIGAEARAGKLAPGDQMARAQQAQAAAADKQAAKAAAKAGRGKGAQASSQDGEAPSSVNGVYPPAQTEQRSNSEQAQRSGVNGVYSPALPEQPKASDGQRPGVVTVRLLPADPRESATAILAAMDHRQAVQLASELLELLKREAEPQAV